MSGHDYELVDEPIKELECHICFLLIKDAVELACGHSLCSECLDKWEQKTAELKITFDCPQCKESIKKKKVKINHTINRIITTSIRIRCQNYNEGCKWQGVISNNKDHLEKHCQYALIKCKHLKCTEMLFRNCMNKHLENNCLYRPIACWYCKELVVSIEIRKHNDECPQMIVSCPNTHCEKEMKREELEKHVGNCLFQMVPCEFVDAGCTELVPRKTLSIHMQECTQKHLYLMLSHMKTTEKKREEENAKRDLELHEMREKLVNLRTEFNDYMKLSNLERQVHTDMKVMISGMKSVCRMVKEAQHKLQENLMEAVDRFDKSFHLLEGGILNFNTMISNKVKTVVDRNSVLAAEYLEIDVEHMFLNSVKNHSSLYLNMGVETAKKNLHFSEYSSKCNDLKEDISSNLAKIHDSGYETSYFDRFMAMLNSIPVNKKIVYNDNQFLLKLEILDCFEDEWSINVLKKLSFFGVGLEKHDDVHVYKMNKNIKLYFGEELFSHGIPSVTVCNPRQLYKLRLPSTSKDDMTVRVNFGTLEKSNYVINNFVLLRITEVPKMQIDPSLISRINSFSGSFHHSS